VTDTRDAIERCLDEDKWVNVARFKAKHLQGEFTIEFGNHGTEPPVWNIASHPPVEASDFGETFVHDSSDAYVLLNSDALNTDDAVRELEEIAATADATSVHLATTFRGAEVGMPDFRGMAKHYIIDPLRRRIGGRK